MKTKTTSRGGVLRRFAKIFFLTFFLCAVRNNGLYALLPALIVGFFVLKIKSVRKNFLIAFSLPILVFLGYNNFFIKNIVTTKDSFFQETLNIPHIQIARTAYKTKDEEVLKMLKEYYVEGCPDWQGETWGWYRGASGISDPFKGCTKLKNIDENPLGYFSTWAKIGLKYPNHYLLAVGKFTAGLWYPFVPYNPGSSGYMWHTYVDGGFGSREKDGLSDVDLLPEARKFLKWFIADQKWSKVPILDQLWRGPVTTFLCLIAIILVFKNKKRHFLLPLSFVFGLLLTVALSPVVLFRYLLPAVLVTPIMVYVIIKSRKEKVERKYGKNSGNRGNWLHRLTHRNRAD